MSDMLSQIEEIQNNIREIKSTWGNTVMMLDNIKSALKADRQKAIDDAYDRGYKECFSEHKFDVPCSLCDDYERGLNDAWDAARKINMVVDDGGLSSSTLMQVFGTSSNCAIMRTFTVKEAIAKIKAHEAEKDEIRVGDEMKQVTDSGKETGLRCTVTRLSGDSMSGISSEGYTVFCDSQVDRWWKKTGKHFDIESILKEMQS